MTAQSFTSVRRLLAERRGVALTEFAIVLPAMLTLGLMGIEVANYAIATLRVSQIAMSAADNAGRVRDSISEADVNDLLTGAKLVGAGIKFADHGRIILSDLEQRTDDATKQWIRWQRCTGAKHVGSTYGAPRNKDNTIIADGTEAFRTDGITASAAPSNPAKSVPSDGSANTPATMGPSDKHIASAPATAVMFVEVVYDYQPIVWTNYLGTRTLRDTIAFNVRQRTNQTLQPAGLAYASWSTCNRYAS